MHSTTLLHNRSTGWSPPGLPTELDSARTLVLCFGSPSYADDPSALRELADAFPNSVVTGCSTAGEIHGRSLHDDVLAVAVARFESVDLSIETTALDAMSLSETTGRRLGRRLAARSDARNAIVFSDGLTTNGSALLDGLRACTAAGTRISGGLAADGPHFNRTWVLHEGEPRSGIASAVGLSGTSLRVGYGSMGGWDIFGPERRVTRSVDNVLYELDGRPALDLYREYLGDLAADLPASGLRFPLSLRPADDETPAVVRTILAIDDARGSLTFAGNIPQGHMAQLMRANPERLLDGATGAAVASRTPHAEHPVLSIAISCVGRRLVLGERTEDEIEAAFDALPDGSRQIGFYSYGEICPSGALTCGLQNQTMTITTLGEHGV